MCLYLAPPLLIDEAVDFWSFENVQTRERAAANPSVSRNLRPGNVDNPESSKTRCGIIGGYSDYLVCETLIYVNSVIAETGLPFNG